MIQFQLDGLKETDEKGYLLKVQNLKKDPGVYFDTIILTTDSKIQPQIPINIHTRIVDTGVAKKKSAGQSNPFLELIQKMQKEKTSKKGGMPLQKADPEKAEEFKKKFEALIKQDKQKKN